MMKGQTRRSGLVMGFDTHMIAGAVPALRPARPTQPNITNRSNPHYDETLLCWPSTPITTTATVRTAPWGRHHRSGPLNHLPSHHLEASYDEIDSVG